jgi:hypothetical protein
VFRIVACVLSKSVVSLVIFGFGLSSSWLFPVLHDFFGFRSIGLSMAAISVLPLSAIYYEALFYVVLLRDYQVL